MEISYIGRKGGNASHRISGPLVLWASRLPVKIEELRDFVLLSSEKLKVYRAKIRAVDKLNFAKELRDEAIKEGQILAEQAFSAEARLGELLKGLDLQGGDRKSESFKNQSSLIDGRSSSAQKRVTDRLAGKG